MTPLELHTAAWALIADPKHWTTRVFARDRLLICVPVNDPNAVCFCSLGALRHFNPPELIRHLVEEALDKASDIGKNAINFLVKADDIGKNILIFNDTHTHEEVMATWQRAGTILEQTT